MTFVARTAERAFNAADKLGVVFKAVIRKPGVASYNRLTGQNESAGSVEIDCSLIIADTPGNNQIQGYVIQPTQQVLLIQGASRAPETGDEVLYNGLIKTAVFVDDVAGVGALYNVVVQ